MEIMVVDDKEDIRNYVTTLLEKKGHRVITAQNGKEAIDNLVVYKVDLIITDIIMPEIEGIEFIMRLRQSNIPIISISGLTKETIISEFIVSLGIVGFLQKPFNSGDLLKLIANVDDEIARKKETVSE